MCTSRTRAVGVILLLLGLAAVLALRVHAVESVQLSFGDIVGDGWSLEDVSLQLNWTGETSASVELQATKAHLPGELGSVSDLRLACASVELTATVMDCREGRLVLKSSRLGRQSLPLSVYYHHADHRIRIKLRNIRLAAGRVAMSADYQQGSWSAEVQGAKLQLAGVARELRIAGVEIPPLTVEGRIGLQLSLKGQGAGVTSLAYAADLQSESFSDETGRYAGEGLAVSLKGTARPLRNSWRVKTSMTARQGAVYIDPVYVEVGTVPIAGEASFDWTPGRQRLTLRDFSYRHPGTLDLAGKGRLDFQHAQPLRQLRLALREVVLPSAYATYLQPWLTESLAGNLEMAGQLRGDVRIDQGGLVQASADLQSISLSEKGGLFGLDNLSGHLAWSVTAAPEYSTLSWDSGHVYRVSLGRTAIELESTGQTVRLLQPVRIPVLDGALDIESFSLAYPSREALHWDIDGILTPVSMQQLTRALEWPEFGGRLSGVIPAVRYDAGVLSVGGVLLVRVFDGEVTLRDLELTNPLGLVPRLRVNAKVDNIDLESLTRAFSFGRIEGRLDGHVDNLLLESWMPVAFDAAFATPEDDKSRHRISQKAVDNISNIGGGGVGGALSRSFLRIFEDFPYDRLGIRCRLQNGVCEMGGVAPAENGYYLVKGSFLPPRLDVVGFADRVNWDSLVAQIIAVTREQNVIVE